MDENSEKFRHKDCRMLVVYDYPTARLHTYDDKCEVIFDEPKITLSFFEYNKPKKWEGVDKGSGHYEVRDSDIVNHWGTLHRMPGSNILEGRWNEEGLRGFWEITLGPKDQFSSF